MTHTLASMLRRADLDRAVVPMIQRDYAQGRPDDDAARIRRDFVAALARSAMGGDRVSLDFVYGAVANRRFEPLDGQQRLTTLFLLHVYLAARAKISSPERAFLAKFGYEVRPSAEAFCEALVGLEELPAGSPLSDAIVNEPWFVPGWRRDPTIAGMLVVLDEIDRNMGAADPRDAWDRLVAPGSQAITFHHLDLTDVGPAEVLYVRMNSRGKRLTDFENFKAELLGHAERVVPGSAHELAEKLDGEWGHAFWPYRGENNVIDEEIERYLHFVVDVEARLTQLEPGRRPDELAIDWAGRVLCGEAGVSPVAVLARHFDPWSTPAEGAKAFFKRCFAVGGHEPGKITLFRPDTADLLAACTLHYRAHPPAGQRYQQNVGFGLLDELLLYASGVHRRRDTPEFQRRARVLRNLGEATELQANEMGELLAASARLVQSGLDAAEGPWLGRQVAEEHRKATFIDSASALVPTLHRLEDHRLVRGITAAFRLDDRLPRLVDALYEAFPPSAPPRSPQADPALHLALLATAAYPWWPRWGVRRIVDGSADSWRKFLAREGVPAEGDAALTRLLERLSEGERPDDIVGEFLTSALAKGRLDWRWYVLRYPTTRARGSGHFQFVDDAGFDLRQLAHSTTGAQKEDAYLSAVRAHLADFEGELSDWGYWDWQLWSRALAFAPFPERWLTHLPTRQHVRFTRDSVVLRDGTSAEPGHDEAVAIAQTTDGQFDREDRVALAARLFRERIEAAARS